MGMMGSMEVWEVWDPDPDLPIPHSHSSHDSHHSHDTRHPTPDPRLGRSLALPRPTPDSDPFDDGAGQLTAISPRVGSVLLALHHHQGDQTSSGQHPVRRMRRRTIVYTRLFAALSLLLVTWPALCHAVDYAPPPSAPPSSPSGNRSSTACSSTSACPPSAVWSSVRPP